MADPTNPTDPTLPKVDYGKSTLFRFFHMKEPELVVKPNLTYAVLQVPTQVLRVIVGKLQGGNEPPVPATEGEAQPPEEEIPVLKSLSDLRALDSNLLELGEWLSKNNKPVVFNAVKNAISGKAPLSSVHETTLWFNLLAFVIKGNKNLLADKIINVLRASKFVTEFTNEIDPTATDFPSEDTREKYQFISTAIISVPNEIIPSVSSKGQQVASALNPIQQNALKKRQAVVLAAHRVEKMERVIAQIKRAEDKYEAEKEAARKVAYEQYKTDLATFLEQNPPPATPNVDGTETPPTPIILPSFPPFEFNYSTPFNIAYLNTCDCISEANDLLHNLSDTHTICGTNNTISDAKEYLDKEIGKAKREIVKKASSSKRIIQYNGFQISSNEDPLHNSYVIQLVKAFESDTNYSLLFTQFSKQGATKVSRINAQLQLPSGTNLSELTLTKLSETEEFVSYLLFENQIPVDETALDSSFVLSGSYFIEDPDFTGNLTTALKLGAAHYGPALRNDHRPAAQFLTKNDGTPGSDDHPAYGIKKIGIGEYNKVEQEVCCYVPGEVSHIENVMAREYREKRTRDLSRSEITTEETEETEEEHTKDTSSTERHEMHKEISQMLAKEQSTQLGANAGVSGSYSGFGATVSANSNFNMNTTNSSSSTANFSQAETFAKELTQKAVDRLLRKVSYKRTAKMIREFEETNDHGYDNRAGKTHVVGIYRWIDKIFKNTLLNYGKRLMYDFMIPEPSKNFKYWLQDPKAVSQLSSLEDPQHPDDFMDGKGHKYLDRTNFAQIAARYGADVKDCPADNISVGGAYGETMGTDSEYDHRLGKGKGYELELPDGYECKKANVQYSQKFGHSGATPMGSLSVGDFASGFSWNDYFGGDINYINAVEGKIPIGVNTSLVRSFSVSVIAYCTLTAAAKEKWQNETYLAIMEAYHKKKQAFLDAQAAIHTDPTVQKDYNYNPSIGRSIEERELKRACIEMMLRSFRSAADSGRDGYEASLCNNLYRLQLDATLDEHAKMVNFMEQAFEWNIMSYLFYPYFYGNQADWGTLIKEKSTADPIFEAFLQSGMARVTVTVRPKFEKAVLYFLDTGTIPMGEDFAPEDQSDLYLSISELLTVKTDEEQLADKDNPPKTWETRVPTDLVILQAGASPLNQNGLPCVCKDGLADEGLGIGDNNVMGTNTDVAIIIKDVKDALVDVIKAVGEIKSTTNATPNP